ncbi:ssDNA-binding protein, partial [Enterococcus faecium]|uniref:ssDNA-binding protein n=1 Tax=Enterococcus faecium TaxID=1352 RepID=UPI003175EE6B
MSKTSKVITGTNTRLSYFHGWEPASINGGAEKYSTAVLIPKSDKRTIDTIEKAIDAAIEEGLAKFGGKKPNKAEIMLPLRDGDIERDDEAYQGHYFIN